jgi:hypothetical protein
MRPVKTRVSALEFLREHNCIAQVGLADQRDAFNAIKVLCPGKCYAHPMPRVCTVSEKICTLHGVYAEVLDPELFIFGKYAIG